MSTLVLPQSMVADRDAGIKANAQHVDDNFGALTNAVNGKLDLDGSSTPTADISMASHKLTNVATPTLSGDAATKGYTDSALLLKADLASPTFTGTPTAPTPSSSDDSTNIATTAFVNSVVGLNVPAGIIASYGGDTAPSGWLICDGSEISRTTYADLFSAIGTKYGSGDGSTTFNLPDFKLQTATVVNVITNGQQPIFTDGSHNGSLRQGMKNLSGYTHYMFADGVSVGEWSSVALKFGSQSGLKVDMSSTAITAIIKC